MSSSDSPMAAGGAGAAVNMTTTTTADEPAVRDRRAAVADMRDEHAADALDTGSGRGTALLAVFILAIIAATIAAFATREGPGLTPDSRGYLLVAEQIHLGHGVTMLDGDGKKVPLTHCPPLYPIMLWAGDALLPGDPDAAARARWMSSIKRELYGIC